MRGKLLGVVALLALVVASCSNGAPSAAGPADTIGVHGAWTLDIVNPDGTLDQTLAFHNELTSNGKEFLADLLALADSHTGWEVVLAKLTGGPNICDTGNGYCYATASASRDGTTNEVVIEATVTPDFDGSIYDVYANVTGTATGNKTFSHAHYSKFSTDPIDVAAGQTVLLEIRYSFTTVP